MWIKLFELNSVVPAEPTELLLENIHQTYNDSLKATRAYRMSPRNLSNHTFCQRFRLEIMRRNINPQLPNKFLREEPTQDRGNAILDDKAETTSYIRPLHVTN